MTQPDPRLDRLQGDTDYAVGLARQVPGLSATVQDLTAKLAAAQADLQRAQAATGAATAEVDKQKAEVTRLQAALTACQEGKPPGPTPTPQPVAQFPGDPGPDKIVVGLNVTGQSVTRLQTREAAIGMKMANRVFDNGGIADLAVPNGPVATKVKRDLADGRVPVPSFRPGVENLAAHKFEAELVAFFKWYQQVLAAAGKYGAAIAHHEPSNDWAADANNLPAMAKHKADWAEAQRWLRACLNKAVPRATSRVIFIGAFMTYEWSAAGVKQWGPADLLNPGMDPDNPTRHVFDIGTGDHYVPNLTAASLETDQLVGPSGFLASMKKWGCPAGLTELGVKTSNPAQATVLRSFLAKARTLGLRLVIYWDSRAGKGGQVSTDPATWWEMTDATLAVWRDFCLTTGANPNA